MTRREFSRDVRAGAFKRCMDGRGTPRCEGCYAALKAGSFAFDHIRADGLLGEPTLANCQVLCTDCHSAKTREHDVPAIARSKAREASHLGIKRPKMRGAGFRRAPPQRSASRPLIRKSERMGIES